LVPVTKGCIANAPDGGHNNHPGALLDGAAVALPEDPPEPGCDDDVEPAVLPTPLDRVVPPIPPADAGPPVAPALVVPVPVVPVPVVPVPVVPVPVVPVPAAPVVAGANVELAVAAGLAEGTGDTVEVVAPVPSVTMPLRVTFPGVTTVCANAGKAAKIDNSIA
jgi:hypothetical protein